MNILKFLLSFFLFSIININAAYAGDGATIVLESGVTFQIRQGYDQLSRAFKEANKSDYANKFVEVKLDGTSVAINLGQVVAICRDKCTSMQITVPKK